MDKIIRAFLPQANIPTLRPLGEGIINTTYAVENFDGKLFVIQKLNTNVFPDPYAVMRNTVGVTSWMRQRLLEEGKRVDRAVPTFLQTAQGEYLYQTEDGEYWRCSKFIEGATAHVHVTDPALLYNAGKGYGEFVRLTDGYDAGSLAEVLPNFHNTKKRYEDFLEAVERNVAGRAHEVDREIHLLAEQKDLAESIVTMLEEGTLPLRVTHNDTKLSNVLLDDETGEAVCVIDLDTVMPGSVLYDFGDAIRSGAASVAEDEPKVDRMKCVRENCEAFREGFLASCGDILTSAEAENLMLGARVIVYEQAMRFLTDYLNGDTYYKTLVPGHNLIRARTQIRLFSQIPD